MEEHTTQHEEPQTETQDAPAQNDSTIEGMIGHDEPIAQEGMQWFVLRVASNKENSVQNTLLRKIQIEGMTHLVDRKSVV